MKIIIDDKQIDAEKKDTVLAAAKRAGISIPSLCHHEGLPNAGACRLCMVEVSHPRWNRPRMVTACEFMVEPGLEVKTGTPDVLKSRQRTLDLLLLRAGDSAVLQKLSKQNGVTPLKLAPQTEGSACISCYLCTRACEKMGCNAISMVGRGTSKKADSPFSSAPQSCIGCGSCAAVCPVDYIKIIDTDTTRTIWGKTFDMVKCKTCGAPVMTVEYRQYAIKNRELSETYYEKCPDCKRLETAQKFGRIGF